MKNLNIESLGSIFKPDKCRRYFPRYDEQTFLDEVSYTDSEIMEYFPQKYVQKYQEFKQAGTYLKIGFWTTDILFVSFCHKIKILSRILGTENWKMFIFKIACIALPFSFLQNIEKDAEHQFYKGFYKQTHKIYKRYKQTGDILDLNLKIILEESKPSIQLL